MTRYTCYVIDATDQVRSVAEIECEAEDTARAEAEEILAARPGDGEELWRSERLVYRAERPGGPR
jgi:hypothetical protein